MVHNIAPTAQLTHTKCMCASVQSVRQELIALGAEEEHAEQIISGINRSRTGDAKYGLGEFRAFCDLLSIDRKKVCSCCRGRCASTATRAFCISSMLVSEAFFMPFNLLPTPVAAAGPAVAARCPAFATRLRSPLRPAGRTPGLGK